MEDLIRKDIPLSVEVSVDEYTALCSKAFDYEFDGVSKFYPWEKPASIPEEFGIGLIVGGSGSGKSSLLKEFGNIQEVVWDSNKSIMSHFETPEIALAKLSAVGLSSIPSWVKPFHVLSNGEQFRADLARKLYDNTIIDEFTSVVDRNVAKASSVALSRYVKNDGLKNIVLASCHRDIIEWLCPDWVIDLDNGKFYDGFFFVRPEINIEIYESNSESWGLFKDHHYLNAKLPPVSRKYIAFWGGNPVGFVSTMTMPSGTLKNAWRESRLVILPEYQGLGIGMRLSDAVAELHLQEGKRYFSRSAHPRIGFYRNNSPLWRPTSKNQKLRTDINHENVFKNHYADNKRVCFSHEYIGKLG